MNYQIILKPIEVSLNLVEEELKNISNRIINTEDRLSKAEDLSLGILQAIAEHPFSTPGKRLRPAMVLISYNSALKIINKVDKQISPILIQLAAATEVLHAASLVHDDVLDDANERRHKISLNKKFGNRIAVLAGDILYTEFFQEITKLGIDSEKKDKILELFLETTKRMCIGEILSQETSASGKALSLTDYLKLCSDKTASLFASCCAGSAVLAGLSNELVLAYKNFGYYFGLCFQILDDIEDKDTNVEASINLKTLAYEFSEKAIEEATKLGLELPAQMLNSFIKYKHLASIKA